MIDHMVRTLDPRSMEDLIEDVGIEAAQNFAAAYHQMLPVRVHRISDALRKCDHDAAMDAVLSLGTSSQLIGALRMAHICNRLEASLLLAHGAAADQDGQEIEDHLPQLQTTLTGYAAPHRFDYNNPAAK